MAYGPKEEAPAKDEKTKELKFWLGEIDRYEKDFKPWETRSKKIVKRYKDERPANNKSQLFNILWSNVQTLAPALYAQAPKPNVDRRFQDNDDLSRTVAQVLERSVSYFVNQENFDEIMKQCVQDRLLPGRGTAWVRYCPYIEDEPQITEDVAVGDPMGDKPAAEVKQELTGEDVIPDYVHWQDFGHTFGRTWQEVRAVWRRVYLDPAQLVKRFGEKGKLIPLDSNDEQDKKVDGQLSKAAIYEIWDKSKKEALWVSKSCKDVIDRVPDPLELMDFFPCPKPIYSTVANDNLIPVPDYAQYQDQARELDLLTNRIGKITEALRVSGVYDKSAEGVQKILTEGGENTLIPVENWAIFGEKGGLKGVIDWFPVDMLAAVLNELYDAREKTKQDLYEITGISDIIRGATDANETATAQQIKGKFATLRLDNMQKDVARFSRDLVRLMAEIIADHFSLETIKKLSGVKLLTQQEKQMLQMQQAQAQQSGMPPASPPADEETLELLDMPTWEEVYAVLKDDLARSYRIDIETDSTIKVDQDAEKQARVEFLTAAGGFIAQAVQVPNPELQPLLMEMLMFGVRGFKVARDLESEFEATMKKLRKAAENPQPPQPSPEVVASELKKQEIDQNGQIEKAKLEQSAQHHQEEIGLRNKELESKHILEMHKIKSGDLKTRLDAKGQATENAAMADPDMHEGPSPIDMLIQQQEQTTAQLIAAMTQGLQQIAQAQAQSNVAVIKAVTATKSATKDRNGNWVVRVDQPRMN